MLNPSNTLRRVTRGRLAITLPVIVICLLASGCAVPQPHGAGELSRIVEPTTGRRYWLYLPSQHVQASETARHGRRWPLVVTFHGMKPFDSAYPQAREWQGEADRFGFIVVAPVLRAPDSMAQFPVRTVHPAFKSDEEATLAILDHVFETTQADRRNVLATSWSSGGYLAHYMLNRHPERFTCLGVRQSNFSESILDAGIAARSCAHPILIVNTENDLAVCKRESTAAIDWYKKQGYRNVAWFRVKGLGHERTPEFAADFFARVAGVSPDGPSTVLVHRQVIDGEPEGTTFCQR